MGFQHMKPVVRKAVQRKGGSWRRRKGFAANPELAKEAGRKGGLKKAENAKSGVTKSPEVPQEIYSLIESIVDE